MKPIKNWILGVALAVMLTATALAADLQKGKEAYDAGDYATALAILTPLAEAGDAEAQYRLGHMYEWGKGVEHDSVEAVYWWLRAAEAGHYTAQRKLGELGELGKLGALLFKLGRKYVEGRGVEQDDAEAMRLFRLAAEVGHEGMYQRLLELGDRSHAGEGVPQNYTIAAKWYRLAAELGIVDAQIKLGNMYSAGEGLPKDARFAYMWFNLAAAQGGKDAKESRDKVAKDMSSEELTEAQEMTQRCFDQNYKNCGGGN